VSEIECWSPLQVWLYSVFSRDRRRREKVVEILAPGPGDHLLDIGCGLGQVLDAALRRGARASGIDPSPAMVRQARRRVPDAHVELGSAEDVPFPDRAFSHVAALDTFHHWADRGAGLREAVRVLAPGGRLLIVEKQLASGTGHGLTQSDAQVLAARLSELGLERLEIGEISVGRHRLLAVSGLKPTPE
jgi:ubiquinone/menaquinone biosynthesis C-methylase UbiE